jgi:hypothetical protein
MNCTCCKDCTKRTLGCHSDCNDYKNYLNNHLEEKRKIHEVRYKETISKSASIEGFKRMKNKRESNHIFTNHIR